MHESYDHTDALQQVQNTQSANGPGVPRRKFLNMPLALAASACAAPWLSSASQAHDGNKPNAASIDPNYYPLRRFKPEIKLRGKLAVITGASRGIGRAIGEALYTLGVDVIGTSRHPADVPNPPAFPLLPLDITEPASVLNFVTELTAHPLFLDRDQPQVDILVNNAGRMVIGSIVPQAVAFSSYLAQRDLGVRTLYSGHVTVTNALLPLMSQQSYSRILFIVSVSGYMTAALLPVGSFIDVYASSKAALRGYANNLDGALHLAGSSIRVSTVNPYFVNTAGFTHPNPIYTQPVNSEGLSDGDANFNAVTTELRALMANGLPPSMVGEACVQLLRALDPDQNVVVASPHGPLADRGANDLIESEIVAENQISAVPFV